MALRSTTHTLAGQYKTTVEHLIALYEKWGKPAQAAEWRKKLPPTGPPIKK